jgi:hypothetical protein
MISAEEKYMKSPKGKKYLQYKIKKNMKEWKKGKWVSQKQALAVSYSQTRKRFKELSRKKRTNRKKRMSRN